MAGETIKGLTVIINGDATQLSKAMRDARAEAGMLRGQLASVGKLMEFNPSSTELVRQKQRLLGEAIAANARTYTRYQQAHAEYSGRIGSLTEAERSQLKKLESEMLKNRVEFQSLTRQANAFGAAMPASFIAAGNAARSMSEGMRSFANYSLGASVAVGAVGAYAVKAAKDYEYAFADVRKTIDATEAEYAELSRSVIEMSLVRPSSAKDLAYIMSLGGQLNIANQYLSKFAATVADLDVATDMELEDASLDMARFMNICGTAQGEVDRLGATIVDLGNNSATTESSIMAMAMRIAGTGSSLGMTAAEVLGVATSLSSVGIQAEMGGNAISTIMRRIDKDVQTGSSTLSTWASVAGMSAQQFKTLWTEDVAQGLIAVIRGMGQFQDEGGSLTLLMNDLGISYMRQVDTMMRMAQAGDMANEMITRANTAWSQNSALSREVEQRYDTNEAKLQMMGNAAQAAAIAFGDELLPSFRDVVVGATDLVQAVASLDSGTKDTIVTVGAGVVGFGLFTKALQVGSGVFGTWIGWVGKGVTAVTGWSTAIAGASAAETAATAAKTAGATASTASAAATTAQAAAQTAATATTTGFTGALGRLSVALFGTQAAALGVVGVVGALLVAGVAVAATAMASYGAESERYTASTMELKDSLDAAKQKFAETALTCREGSVELARARAELDAAQAAWDEGAETVAQMNDRLEESASSWADARSEMGEATREADSQAGAMLAAADGLARSMETMAAGPEKSAQVLAFVDALNESIEGLNLAYDEQADKLNMSVDAVTALADAEARRAMAEQSRSNYNETYAERARQMRDLADAEATLKKEGIDLAAAEEGLYRQYGVSAANLNAVADRTKLCSAETMQLIENWKGLKQSVAESDADLQRYLDSMAEAASVDEAAAEAVRLMSEESLTLEEAVAAVSDGLDEETVAMAASALAQEQAAAESMALAEAQEELDKEVQKVADGLQELAMGSPELATFLADSRIDVEALAEAMHASGIEVSDLEKRMQEFADSTADAMEKIEKVSTEGEDGMSASKMMKNLEANYDVANQWGEAMRELYDRHGGEASAAFLSYMADLGYEYTPLVQEFAAMSDEAWDAYIEQYNENLRLGHENALIGFKEWAGQYNAENVAVTSQLAEVWDTVGEDAVQGFTNAIVALGADASDVLSGMAAMSEGELTEFVAQWQQAGWSSKEEFLAGMSGVSESAAQVASEAKSAVDGQLSQLPGQASARMGEVKSVIVQGIGEASGAVDGAVDTGIARPLYDKLDGAKSEVRTKSRAATDAAAAGVESGKSRVSEAASSVARAGVTAANASVASFRSTGFNMASGMAAGLNSGKAQVRAAAASLVAAAAAATNMMAYITSPSMLFRLIYLQLPLGAPLGIDRGAWRVTRAMERLVDSAAAVPLAPALASLSAAPPEALRAVRETAPATAAASARAGATTVVTNNVTNVDGVTYDDGTAVYDAVGRVFRAAKIKRRRRG